MMKRIKEFYGNQLDNMFRILCNPPHLDRIVLLWNSMVVKPLFNFWTIHKIYTYRIYYVHTFAC